MISLNRRNFQAHSREEIYQAVGEVIGERWKVRSYEKKALVLWRATSRGGGSDCLTQLVLCCSPPQPTEIG